MATEQIRPNYYKIKVMATVPHALGIRAEVEVECFDLIDAFGFGFYLGNALKYLFRLGKKKTNIKEDLKKTLTYVTAAYERNEEPR